MPEVLEELRIKQKTEQMRAYLNNLAKGGAKISLEGYSLPIAQMAKVMSVCEGFCYMPDIDADDDGTILEVRFDRVSLS